MELGILIYHLYYPDIPGIMPFTAINQNHLADKTKSQQIYGYNPDVYAYYLFTSYPTFLPNGKPK